jgi:hypothetical protein
MDHYTPPGARGDEFRTHWVQPTQQARLLNKLLQALYLQPYTLGSPAELESLVDLADYYCMLRIISRTLDGVLDATEDVARLLRQGNMPCWLLPAAAKLRHKRLFSDCILLSIGPWHQPNISNIEDPNLRAIAQAVRGRMSVKVANILEHIISTSTSEYGRTQATFEAIVRDIAECGRKNRVRTNKRDVCLPLYIKAISGLKHDDRILMLGDACFEVLVNRLYLSPHVDFEMYSLEDRFLCEKITDEELPWDIHEADW